MTTRAELADILFPDTTETVESLLQKYRAQLDSCIFEAYFRHLSHENMQIKSQVLPSLELKILIKREK